MQTLLLMLVAAVCAVVIPIQAIVNGRLGQLLANPLLAALTSFLTGGMALLVVALGVTRGIPTLPKGLTIGDIPPYLLTGGCLGAVYVTVVLTLVPRIGAANVVAAGLVGQLITSVIIDHYAILGVPQSSVSLPRLLGCALLLAGMLLIQRG
jgi:transporter family-2 protein